MSSDLIDSYILRLEEYRKELDLFKTPMRPTNIDLLKYPDVETRKHEILILLAKIEIILDLYKDSLPPNEYAQKLTFYNDARVAVQTTLRQLETKKITEIIALLRREDKPLNLSVLNKRTDEKVQSLKAILQSIRDAQILQAGEIAALKQGAQLSKQPSRLKNATKRNGRLSRVVFSRPFRSTRKK